MATKLDPIRALGGDAKSIGAAIRAARAALGMTTTQFGKKVGISQAQISRLENGIHGFRSETMQKVARALGTPVVIYCGPEKAAAKLREEDVEKTAVPVSSNAAEAPNA